MIDDRRDHKLTGNGETGGHGSSEPLDTEAADGHDQHTEKAGRIQIPRHSADCDPASHKQKDIKDQQKPSGKMNNQADAHQTDIIGEHAVKCRHG